MGCWFSFCHAVVILYVANKLQVTNRKDRSYSMVRLPVSFHFTSLSAATMKIIDTIQPEIVTDPAEGVALEMQFEDFTEHALWCCGFC